MKRLFVSIVLSLFMFTNFFIGSLGVNLSANAITYADQPELQIYEEHASLNIGYHYDYDAIYNGFAKAYIDSVGTTRGFVTLYDNNFKVTNTYILKDSEFDQLALFDNGFETLNEVINNSNAVWIENQVVIYYHTDDTHDGSSRHKLIVIDVTNKDQPIYNFVSLNPSGEQTTYTINEDDSSFELEYIDNKLYLTAIDEADYFSISEITFNLSSSLTNGYRSGIIRGIVNSDAAIVSPTANSNLDFCQAFGINAYCLDLSLNSNSVYYLSINNLDVNVLSGINHNRYFIGTKTLNDLTTFRVYYYQYNQNSNQLEANLISEIQIENQFYYFPHIDYRINSLVFFTDTRKYIINLTNYNVTNSVYQNEGIVQVLYNEVGDQLKVRFSDQQLYATSSFDNLTYPINTFGSEVLALQYFGDYLLILAVEGSGASFTYKYYKYRIRPSSNSSNPDYIGEFSSSAILASLNQTYNGAPNYASIDKSDLFSFVFDNQDVYLIHRDMNNSINYLSIIKIIPIGQNGVISSYKYQLANNTLFDTFVSYFVTTNQNKKYLAITGSEGGVKTNFRFGIPNLLDNQADVITILSNGVDNIATFMHDDKIHAYNFDYNDYFIEYVIDDGINPIVTNIKIPALALEYLTNKSYGSSYMDFNLWFPYLYISFYLDSYNNLLIRDQLGNTHILYNPNLRSDAHPGIIGINGDYTYNINNTSFDILVNNAINTISVVTDAFFKRVLVTNSSPFNLNEGLNVITTTLKALDNTIRTITFNVFRAPSISTLPPITLPGLDPNYVSSSSISSSVVSSSIASSSVSSSSSSSIINSSSVSSSIISSSISSSISLNSSVSSPITSNNDNNSNNQEKPYFIIFLVGLPAGLTFGLYTYISYLKKKPKVKINQPSSSKGVSPEDSKDNKI